MRYATIFLIVLSIACGQGKKYHDAEKKIEFTGSSKLNSIKEFQHSLNAEYRNPETSPLPDRYRKDFDGLDFFPADTNYVVEAKFVRAPDAKPFLMPTTTDRKSEEVVYGIAHFKLNGKSMQLEVYRSLELATDEKYEDYLFLPFLDETNGKETYGGGRYIDLTIPKGDILVIDFNKAYNPYCVYNKKYSCPLVPRQNYLNTKVLAGVQDFDPWRK